MFAIRESSKRLADVSIPLGPPTTAVKEDCIWPGCCVFLGLPLPLMSTRRYLLLIRRNLNLCAAGQTVIPTNMRTSRECVDCRRFVRVLLLPFPSVSTYPTRPGPTFHSPKRSWSRPLLATQWFVTNCSSLDLSCSFSSRLVFSDLVWVGPLTYFHPRSPHAKPYAETEGTLP